MDTLCERRAAAPLALLAICQTASGQNSLDLEEADARNAAYTIMMAAEEQFDCEIEEHSMRAIGNDSGARYVYFVTAEGDECREALLFATNMAARDNKLLFRQIERNSQPVEVPMILYDQQVLIHKVNPEIGEKEPQE